MRERSKIISELRDNEATRAAYIKTKLSVLISSQIKALRLKSKTLSRQEDLGAASGMHQSRISAIETPGAVNFNLETLVRMAAAFKVGLMVKFVSFGEMLEWDNNYSQDIFNVVSLDDDEKFLNPIPQDGPYGGNIITLADVVAKDTSVECGTAGLFSESDSEFYAGNNKIKVA